MAITSITDILSVDPVLWNDWQWQMRQKPTCSDVGQLAQLGLMSANEPKQRRRIGLTPYNVKLLLDLRNSDPQGFRAEMLQSFLQPTDSADHQWVWAKRHDLPLGKLLARLPIPQFLKTLFTGRGSDTDTQALENIYPNTDVIIATAVCARHCSFCFREVGDAHGEAARMTGGMETVLQAVQQVIARGTPHVLVTGGDPLTRSNVQLRQLLTPLVESQTVQVLRLATRLVVDLPMRFFDEELMASLAEFASAMKNRHASLRLVTHVNHPCELTADAIRAIENIQGCGVEVMNQTAVLRGVNDDIETLGALFMRLDRLGVWNHKMFHSMPVAGTEQLRVSLRRFRELAAGLHQWLPGTAVPQANAVTLVGKMPISPSGRWMIPIPFTRRVLVRSFRGEWYLFKDVMDWFRFAREASIALVCAALLGMILLWPSNRPQQTRQEEVVHVTHTVILADEIGYPDAWARQRFQPFVQANTLYLPIHGIK